MSHRIEHGNFMLIRNTEADIARNNVEEGPKREEVFGNRLPFEIDSRNLACYIYNPTGRRLL